MFYTVESAISSWFGYAYQGSITIWFLLNFIKKVITEYKINNYKSALDVLKDYVLEIEGMEDFDIKKGDNYIYINQVKSGSSKNPLTEDVVQQLVLKIVEYKNKDIKGVFHVVDESYKLADINKTYNLLKVFYEEVIDALDELGKLQNYDYEELLKLNKKEKINKENKQSTKNDKIDKIDKHKSIIKSHFKDIEYKDRKTHIASVKQTFVEFYEFYVTNKSAFEADVYSKISIDKTRIKGIENASSLIENNINDIKKILNFECDSREIRLCFQELLYRKIDEAKTNKQLPIVSFFELVKIFKEPFDSYMIEYKECLIKAFEEHKLDWNCDEICSCKTDSCSIEDARNSLYEMSDELFPNFIQNIMPHRNLEKCRDIYPSIIKETVFDCMCKINHVKLMNKIKIAGTMNGKWYWAVAFNEKSGSTLIKHMNENKNNILELLYEADYLITERVKEMDDINIVEPCITSLTENELEIINKSHDYKRINKPKKIGITNIEEAIKIFNGDDKDA